jgi:hypothetical protein
VKIKFIGFLFAALLGFAAIAEAQVATFYQPLGTNLTTDTVTNTGTAYVSTTTALTSTQDYDATTVQVVVTKISGTVGGTISLMGSIDGTNFKALNTAETQTALATITATDASNVYHWRLSGSPFLYYRVSWTGTGTMAATLAAKLYRSR